MAGGPDKGGGSNDEMVYVAAFLLFAGAIYAIWTFARPVIVWAAYALDLPQILAITSIFSLTAEDAGFAQLPKDVFLMPKDQFVELYGTDLNGIPFEWIQKVSAISGYYFKWIFTAILSVFALLVLFKMRGGGLARKFTLSGGKNKGPSLAHYQAQHWKVTFPGVYFDPDNAKPEEAPAKTPMEWMKENNVSLTETTGLDYDSTKRAFEKQLGVEWSGLDNASVYIKAMCVIFYLNAKRDKTARSTKEFFAVTWTTNKRKDAESKTDEFIKDFMKKDAKFKTVIEKHANKHAYTNTAMYKLLEWARQNGGVLASAEFRWLKPIDRSLWYVLNNCGRRSFHIEGAGAVSHFHAEKITRQGLVEPHVDQAVDGLEEYLEHQGIVDLEEFFRAEKKEL